MKTDEEIADLARRLAKLLDEPEYGLFTWVEARNRVARELHAALHEKLDPDTCGEVLMPTGGEYRAYGLGAHLYEIPRNATPTEIDAIEDRAAAQGEAERDGDHEPLD